METLHIEFEGVDVREANLAAARLRSALLDLGEPGLSAEVQKTNSTTMDAGTVLTLVFGAPAIVALAKGISTWIAREGERAGKLVIKTRAGTVVATGHATKNIDVAKTVAALTKSAP